MIYVIPLVVVTIIYLRIWYNLRSHFIINESNSFINYSNTQKRLMKKMLTLMFIFVIASLPEHIVHFVVHFDNSSFYCLCYQNNQQTLLICKLIGTSKGLLNIFAYFTLVPDLRNIVT